MVLISYDNLYHSLYAMLYAHLTCEMSASCSLRGVQLLATLLGIPPQTLLTSCLQVAGGMNRPHVRPSDQPPFTAANDYKPGLMLLDYNKPVSARRSGHWLFHSSGEKLDVKISKAPTMGRTTTSQSRPVTDGGEIGSPRPEV